MPKKDANKSPKSAAKTRAKKPVVKDLKVTKNPKGGELSTGSAAIVCNGLPAVNCTTFLGKIVCNGIKKK